jgi:hypothetical protein
MQAMGHTEAEHMPRPLSGMEVSEIWIGRSARAGQEARCSGRGTTTSPVGGLSLTGAP